MWEKVWRFCWTESVVEHTKFIIKPHSQPGHKSAVGKVNRLRDDAVKHIFEALHLGVCYGVVLGLLWDCCGFVAMLCTPCLCKPGFPCEL